MVFFTLSLLAHILFLRFFELDSLDLKAQELSQFQKETVIPVKVKVQPIDQKQADQLQAHQVIEVPPGPDQEPDHAKYLAERAMRAEKETMARPGASFAGHGAPPVSSHDLFQQNGSQEQRPETEKQPGGQGLANKLELTPVEASGLFSKDPGGGYRGQSSYDSGGGIDFLGGAAMGDITMANAYKFKYARFFNDLKRSIAFYWNPEPALYLLPPMSGDLITKVKFVFNSDGSLADLEVLSSSQFQAVDRAAESAIRSSAPVFNIPQEMLDQNKQLPIICEFRILTTPRR